MLIFVSTLEVVSIYLLYLGRFILFGFAYIGSTHWTLLLALCWSVAFVLTGNGMCLLGLAAFGEAVRLPYLVDMKEKRRIYKR